MVDLNAEINKALIGLSATLLAREWQLSVAESCTGGMLSQFITAIPGSSTWFDCGFVTYSNHAKSAALSVPANLIATEGAVSEAVAIEMAHGALAHSQSQLSVAITGIAGPTGGSEEKPVGTVCFAWASQQTAAISVTKHFSGERKSIREQSVLTAIKGLSELISRVTN